jgi:(p)ppGpp synthase/HD superfamily hydrolase
MKSDKGLELIVLAKNFAHMAHTGQFRKDGKTLYFTHVDGVARSVQPQTPENIAAAYLHDVIEDTKYTLSDLTKIGIPDKVVDAVNRLTKTKGIDYMMYLSSIKNNPIARAVKIADMKYNLNDTPSEKQKQKYIAGLEYLA